MKQQKVIIGILILLAGCVCIPTYFFVYHATRSHAVTLPFVGLMAMALGMAIISNVIFAKNAFKA